MRQLANHQSSVDLTPPGVSNQADVASVGQKHILPGGTGTTQHVCLLSAHKLTLPYCSRCLLPSCIFFHTHTKLKPLFSFFSLNPPLLNIAQSPPLYPSLCPSFTCHLCRFCCEALRFTVELAIYRKVPIFKDSIFCTGSSISFLSCN